MRMLWCTDTAPCWLCQGNYRAVDSCAAGNDWRKAPPHRWPGAHLAGYTQSWSLSSGKQVGAFFSRFCFNFIHNLKVEVGSKGDSFLHTASPSERWCLARNTTQWSGGTALEVNESVTIELLQRQFNVILVTVYQEHTGIHSSVSITFISLLLSICTVKEDLMWLPPAYNTSEESDIVAVMVIEQKCCICRPQGDSPNCLNYRYIP